MRNPTLISAIAVAGLIVCPCSWAAAQTRADIAVRRDSTQIVISSGAQAALRSPVARQLLEAENALARALFRHDQAGIARFLAPQYQEFTSTGRLRGRAESLDSSMIADSVRISVATVDTASVLENGNTGVFSGVVTVRGTAAGRPFTTRQWFTDVWIRRGGRWLIAASQGQSETPVDQASSAQPGPSADSTGALRDTTSVRAALLRLEDQWASAHASRDPAPLDRLLADEYVGVTATGDFWPKAKEIAMTRAGSAADPASSNPSQALDSVGVKLYGNVALMTARVTEKAKKTSDAGSRYYYTSAYVWRDGRWQAVMGHVSPAAKP
jgi:ketosteroid isomerase-like protein